MKSQHDTETSNLNVYSDLTGAPRPFRHIWGGVAWGDPKFSDAVVSDHCLVVAGEQADGRLNVLQEFGGKFDAMCEEMVRVKDDLLMQWFMAPKDPPGMFQRLYDIDGLTHYKVRGRSRFNTPIYEVPEPKEKWKTFRGWDVTASVGAYPIALEADFEAARLMVAALIEKGECLLNYKQLPRIEKAQGQGNDASNMPIFRALVGVVWMLHEHKQAKRIAGRALGTPSVPWPEEYEIHG